MKIGNVNLDNNLFLAPMAGYSDVGFRKVCKQFGCGLAYTEMVSAKALFNGSKKTRDLLFTSDIETPKAVQIFGHEPKVMGEVCAFSELSKFDIIDVNMGCPAPKVISNGDGACLLKDIDLAQKILEECVKATDKPITVKYRMGWAKDQSVEFAQMFEEVGVKAITLHARTKEQMYSGIPFYQAISAVKRKVKIPVIANGDIKDKKSMLEIKKLTNADGFMIGRGALGNPWIFSLLQDKKFEQNKLQTIYEHISTLLQFYSEHYVVLCMRKHLDKYLKNESISNEQKQELILKTNLKDVKNLLEKYLHRF